MTPLLPCKCKAFPPSTCSHSFPSHCAHPCLHSFSLLWQLLEKKRFFPILFHFPVLLCNATPQKPVSAQLGGRKQPDEICSTAVALCQGWWTQSSPPSEEKRYFRMVCSNSCCCDAAEEELRYVVGPIIKANGCRKTQHILMFPRRGFGFMSVAMWGKARAGEVTFIVGKCASWGGPGAGSLPC